jgi:hypothetical protein
MDLARELDQCLPEVFEALHTGHIDLGKTREITERTRDLDDDVRSDLGRKAVIYARGHTRGQLRAWLTRHLARLDPDAADRRRKKECTKRRVWVDPMPDGMAIISAYLSAEEAQACAGSLRAKSVAIDGPLLANEADMFVALLTGTALGAPIPVQVIHTTTGPELAGHGPISERLATGLCHHAHRIDLTPPAACSGYTPSPAMIAWVRARDRHCRFPGCRRPAKQCDLDHLIPWGPGTTQASNLACLCRYHYADLRIMPMWC